MSADFDRSHLMFAVATLCPLPLLGVGAVFGGVWIGLACLYMTLFTFALDELVTKADRGRPGSEFPAADALSVTLGVSHFALLALGVGALSGATDLGALDRLGVLVAFGLFFGQVSNSNAHELIHRSDRRLQDLGKWVYISMLFGHHTSAHTRIHHRFVATEDDPNTARLDESFYRFVPRAWIGSFVAGYEIETQMMRQKAPRPPRWRHPYVVYVGGAMLCLGLAAWAGGLLAYLALAGYAQTQLMLSDYVQHYGLMRQRLANGKPEPVGPQHSWNAPHWFSGYLMLNAPRHSDHHAHPAKRYPALDLPDPQDAPTLPRSLPAMAVIALYPALWKRVMTPRARAWSEGRTPGIAADTGN